MIGQNNSYAVACAGTRIRRMSERAHLSSITLCALMLSRCYFNLARPRAQERREFTVMGDVVNVRALDLVTSSSILVATRGYFSSADTLAATRGSCEASGAGRESVAARPIDAQLRAPFLRKW
eukprot:6180269-Pleurochrysis_carterae.AAC.1